MRNYRQLRKSAEDTDKELLEQLAELEHEQWLGWSKDIADKEELSEERVDRWKKDCWKP